MPVRRFGPRHHCHIVWRVWSADDMPMTLHRGVLVCCAIPVLAASLGGQGDRARSAFRIAVLQGSASSASREMLDGFKRRMEQLGRTVTITVVPTEPDGVPATPGRTGSGNTDLVVALGARAATVALRDYRGTPAIGALVARESALPDHGIAASVVLEFPVETELEWMRRLLPQARRIGVLFTPGRWRAAWDWRSSRVASRLLPRSRPR
jgi:ABC-type uncharacterized transport system substrate-binding protein